MQKKVDRHIFILPAKGFAFLVSQYGQSHIPATLCGHKVTHKEYEHSNLSGGAMPVFNILDHSNLGIFMEGSRRADTCQKSVPPSSGLMTDTFSID